VGCGALGGHICEQLVRAGVGFVRIADRDIVELTNLQRQVLFDEEDARRGLPKAVAAAQRLGRINSEVTIEPAVVDVDGANIEELAAVDLILDGTDNVETRYLINDVAVKRSTPWIYGACVKTDGRVMAVVPGKTACLRCVFPDPPKGNELETCDTAGVLGPAAAVVGAMQSAIAIRLLVSGGQDVPTDLLACDVWSGEFRKIDLSQAKLPECICCGQRRFEYLDAPRHSDGAAKLCGRNSVQVRAPGRGVQLADIGRRLAPVGEVEQSKYFVRGNLIQEKLTLTVFPDGRAIISGTTDPARARSIYARFVGA
jgi:molybdopterin/thiamine biosynthesis adenylyltransferase